MIFSSHQPDREEALSQDTSAASARRLPALVRQYDLVLLIILVTIIASDVRGMQFAENAIFFYWFLALATFQLPSLWVFSWLTRQAPRHVPLYVWIMRLTPASLRSVLLFLIWWPGILIALAILGMCASMVRALFPLPLDALTYQYLAFVGLLLCATLLVSLPPRVLRLILWLGGLFYLSAFLFVMAGIFVLVCVKHQGAAVLRHPVPVALPTHFSWSIFGLALLCLFGLNGPLLLDGEIQGKQRFWRGSSAALWWGGLGSFVILFLLTIAWVLLDPKLQVMQTPFLLLYVPIMGSGVWLVLRYVVLAGIFGCALAYLFLFTRAFLLAARMGYLPERLAALNRHGIPTKVILLQSALVLGTGAIIFVLIPMLLRGVLSPTIISELGTGDQLSLFTSVAGSLWCGLTSLMFVFALWLCWKKHRRIQVTQTQRLVLSSLCLLGAFVSLICTIAPLLPGWPALFFSRTHWYPLVLLGVLCSLALAWTIGELPRRSALVREKARSLAREKSLREALQLAYAREYALNEQLLASYEEVNRLYREQERMAMLDAVTGLLNHRAFMIALEQIIARYRRDRGSFLLFFLDLDHFKSINDTWGHLAGDTVLHEVAERLRQVSLPGDMAGRYGGEEFTLLMPGATLEQASEEGERLLQVMRATPCIWRDAQGRSVQIELTVSIGIAAYGLHGTESRELLDRADQAMYEAKQAGRNCARLAGHAHAPQH